MLALSVAALFVASSAFAEEKTPWEADIRMAYVILGSAHPTGGIMPAIAGRYSWTLSDKVTASAGASCGVFGFGDQSHWIGVIGGPTGSISVQPFTAPVRFTLGIEASFGQLPTCNNWQPAGLCMRNYGFFPATSLGFSVYTKGHMAAGGSILVRDVNTWAWHGASWEPGAFARAFW